MGGFNVISWEFNEIVWKMLKNLIIYKCVHLQNYFMCSKDDFIPLRFGLGHCNLRLRKQGKKFFYSVAFCKRCTLSCSDFLGYNSVAKVYFDDNVVGV